MVLYSSKETWLPSFRSVGLELQNRKFLTPPKSSHNHRWESISEKSMLSGSLLDKRCVVSDISLKSLPHHPAYLREWEETKYDQKLP
ncbi:hypothetical protein TNCV_2025201 [Trichonephila clavipes]|nr:hypothetical protein TNCV_2025201 [Trichonephila clavipes]